MEKNVIVLAGMIGAGKSSYTELIAKELGSKAFYESIQDNRILEMFYSDPKRWAFALQIYFLNTRFRSIKRALLDQNNVLDRSIYEDALFTKINFEDGNISEPEMDTYLDLLDNMMEEISTLPKKSPDLLIYLRGSLETVLKRIKLRGRPYEQIELNPALLDYYTTLHARYDDWFDAYDHSDTLVVNIDEIDIHNEADAVYFMDLIRAKLNEIRS
ncbi:MULTISPECIES: deoxynucleoside kinase [unclassified Listeria]|uniref:deoxynucleoside kinase n=1 Tax=unclassified Listeria TaxID=2642072 RepID=UPI000B58DD43|nr:MULTISPECIES: deoxynucleoside kinase [unclassified Listeria]